MSVELEELAKRIHDKFKCQCGCEQISETTNPMDIAKLVKTIEIEARLEELKDMPNYARKINRIEFLKEQLSVLKGDV
jgi:hypothetical protein